MTIPEAASLVLQASVLAQGGDVFLLDMENRCGSKPWLSRWCDWWIVTA